MLHRRPNWAAPLNNSALSREEMDDIKARHGELYESYRARPAVSSTRTTNARFPRCLAKNGWPSGSRNTKGRASRSGMATSASASRTTKPMRNCPNSSRTDPLPRQDSGCGGEAHPQGSRVRSLQRVPMEINYFEAYNRDNVHLVDLLETPIVRVTPTGVQTTEAHLEFDVIAYATGWDAITGAFEAVDIRGVNGLSLREAWADGPVTQHGTPSGRLPQHIDAGSPAKRLGLRQLPAWHRVRRRMGHGTAPLHAGARLHPCGGRPERAGGVGQAREGAVRQGPDPQSPELV